MKIAIGFAGYALCSTFLICSGGCTPDPVRETPECNPHDSSVPECPAGTNCVEYECRQSCSTSSECPRQYEACFVDPNESAGYCAPYQAACSTDSHCHEGFYCASHECQKLPASADCTDGIMNGLETDSDCGGAYCSPCQPGSGCKTDEDCSTSICSGDGTCQAPRCDDGRQNAEETDVDCGGTCPPCDDGSRCRHDEDCLSTVCVEDECQAPSCSDGVANGLEADTDCGGPESGCGACEAGAACGVAADCASGVCDTGGCTAPACDDSIQNGFETDVDCGGLCPTCADGAQCSSGDDCTSGACGALRCLTAGRVFGTASSERFWSVALTAEGKIVAVGEYTDPIDYGTGELPCHADPISGRCQPNAVVVMFQPDGNALWVTPLLPGQPGSVRAVNVLPGGDIAIAGYAKPASGVLVKNQVLVARLDGDGDVVWSRMIGSAAGSAHASSLAADDAGNLAVGGNYQGTFDFDGTMLPNIQNDYYNAFVAVFADDGTVQRVAGYGGYGNDETASVGWLGSDVVIAGKYSNSIDFGKGSHASAGSDDIFVARVNAAGAEVWARTYGGSGTDAASALVAATDRSVLVTGYAASTIDFGNGPVYAVGGRDTFVLHLTEDGGLVDAQRFGSVDGDGGAAISERSDGNIVVAGSFESTIAFDLASTRLESRGEWDGYVALLSPELQVLSAYQIGGTGSDSIAAITSAEGGAAVAVGAFEDTADLGWGPVEGLGLYDAFVVTLSP